jgi:periplasmic protein TonB
MQSSNSYVGLTQVPTRLLVVGGLHVAVIWALINGLHVPMGAFTKPTHTTATFITEDPAPLPVLTPPIVKTTAVAFRPDPPRLIIETNTPGETAITPPPPADIPLDAGGMVAAEPKPVVTGAAVDPRHPLSQPGYPMSSIHLNEQGKIALAVLVGADGRVVDVKVAHSSGSSRLDQAAVNEARAHWRLKPATRNGVPVEQWLTLGVVFRLEDR